MIQQLFRHGWGRFATLVALICVLWGLSSYGYYRLADTLDLQSAYNDGPRIFALYYGVWSLLAFTLFHPSISEWAKSAAPSENPRAVIALLVSCAIFATVILPTLPQTQVPPDENLSDIISAGPWYFLPKTVEVLFQQILITALVAGLMKQSLTLAQICGLTSLLFGTMHLTLALSGAVPFYVLRYTVAATLFGAVTPYLMVRVRNGFAYSFGLHWAWYALDTTISHFVFASS